MSTMTKRSNKAVELELVPSEVSDADAGDLMVFAPKILEPVLPCDDVAEVLSRLWRFDFDRRRYAAAVSRPMCMKRGEHDLAIYLASVADEKCLVRLPYYKRRKLPSKRKPVSDVLDAAAVRGGRITRLVSARDVFSFSAQLGGWNFVLVDPKDGWYSGWKSIQLLRAGVEGSFSKVHEEDMSSFHGFVHPNRWMLFYSPVYLVSKLMLLRLKAEISHCGKEKTRLRREFFECYGHMPMRKITNDEESVGGNGLEVLEESADDEAEASKGGQEASSDADFYRGRFKIVETGVFEALVLPDGFDGADFGDLQFPPVVASNADIRGFREERTNHDFDSLLDHVVVGRGERGKLEACWFGSEKASRRSSHLRRMLADLQFQCRAVEYAIEDRFKVLSGGEPKVLRKASNVGSSACWQDGFKFKPRSRITWKRLSVGGGLNLGFRTRVKKEKVWL